MDLGVIFCGFEAERRKGKQMLTLRSLKNKYTDTYLSRLKIKKMKVSKYDTTFFQLKKKKKKYLPKISSFSLFFFFVIF